MAEQVFVVGRNRSGTKWLSNVIANHKDISAVQGGKTGVLESNILLNFPKLFDLSNIEDKSAFEILFKESSFYHYAGIQGCIIGSDNYKTYYEFFNSFMDELAEKNGTHFWLQKVNSSELPVLKKTFANAKFIVIQRKNIVENTISNILLYDNKISFRKMFANVLGYWRYRKIENKFKKRDKIFFVQYENLKKDNKDILKQTCEFIGIPFYNEILNVSYKPNTSYKKSNKEDYINRVNKTKIYLISFFIRLIPLTVLNLFTKVYHHFNKTENKFQPLTFDVYRKGKNIK